MPPFSRIAVASLAASLPYASSYAVGAPASSDAVAVAAAARSPPPLAVADLIKPTLAILGGGGDKKEAIGDTLPDCPSTIWAADDLVGDEIDKWQAQLRATLATHCDETSQPLMRVGGVGHVPARDRAGTRGAKWLYTVDDLVQLLETAQHPNHVTGRTGARSWCLTPLELWTPRLPQLRQMFAEKVVQPSRKFLCYGLAPCAAMVDREIRVCILEAIKPQRLNQKFEAGYS